MSIISYILSPPFLTSQIYLISLVLSGIMLMLWEALVLKGIIFPIADVVRDRTARSLRFTRVGESSWMTKILSEGLATLVFIIYSYIGVVLITNYVIYPILGALRGVITLVVIVIFLLLSYTINNIRIRDKLFL